MNKTTLYWLLQISGWFTYGFVQFLVLNYDGQSIDKMLMLGEGLQMIGNILITHGFRLLIIRFGWLEFKLPKLIPLVLTGILVMCFFASILWVLILGMQSGASMDQVPIGMVAEAMVVGLLESFFVFSFWSFAYFIYLYIERYNKSLKYEATIREVELTNLKSQLNPHFIFNALNSIRALVDENPKKSKEAITQLSHILRNSLNSDREKLVPISEELKTVRDYLSLESIRFEERLETKITLGKGTDSFQVPPLMIQTLVENGVKHGIAKLTKGGKIEIETKKNEERLLIRIRNSGQINGRALQGSGLGLANTRKRLEMIYGENASFEIGNENENYVLTQITIPK